MANDNQQLKSWEQVYQAAFKDTPADQLKMRAAFQEATRNGVPDVVALSLARQEAFTIAGVGAFAVEAQHNMAALALQLHHDLNERTGYLSREVGRLWQQRGRGGLGTQLYNGVAGSVIGQRLGLTPIPGPAPAPFNPIPHAPNPHRNATTPPVISAKLATIITPGGTIDFAPAAIAGDPTDAAFYLNITLNALSSAAIGDTICHVTFGTAYDKAPIINRNFESAFAGSPLYLSGITASGFDIKTNIALVGGTTFVGSFSTLPTSGDSTF